MKSLNFHAMLLTIVLQKPSKVKLEFTLKLRCSKPNSFNNEEHLTKCVEQCQRNLELGGSIIEIVYMDEVGFNLHLQLVVKESLHMMSHLAPTIYTVSS